MLGERDVLYSALAMPVNDGVGHVVERACFARTEVINAAIYRTI